MGAAGAGRGAPCGDSTKCGGRGPKEVSLGHPHIHRWGSRCLQHRRLRGRQEKAALGPQEEAFKGLVLGHSAQGAELHLSSLLGSAPAHTQVPAPHSFPSGTAWHLLFPFPSLCSPCRAFWVSGCLLGCTQRTSRKTLAWSKDTLSALLLGFEEGFFWFVFLRFYLFTFREKGRERNIIVCSLCGCLSHSPYWGPGPQSRHVL